MRFTVARNDCCLLYTSDAADERSSVDLGGRRIIKKKKKNQRRGKTISQSTKMKTADENKQLPSTIMTQTSKTQSSISKTRKQ